MNSVLEQLAQLRLVPMVAIDNAEHADGFGAALAECGLPVAEITFRTDAAEDAIRALAKRGDLLVGAGTVLTTEHVDRAIDAGAAFLVSPGTNPKVVEHCLKRDIPIVPGVATPTDIELGLSLGLSALKFFPAENMGGVGMLRALAGPYSNVRFLATGGVTPEKLPEYLLEPNVIACGGSWIAPRAALAGGDFDAIRKLVTLAAKLLASLSR